MKQILSKSEAIQYINAGKHVYSDIDDGYIAMYKNSKTTYRIEVWTLESQPTVYEGDYKGFLKTMNNSKQFPNGFYYEEHPELGTEEESSFCDDCQSKFEAQNGELALIDMCEECQVKTLKSIVDE